MAPRASQSIDVKGGLIMSRRKVILAAVIILILAGAALGIYLLVQGAEPGQENSEISDDERDHSLSGKSSGEDVSAEEDEKELGGKKSDNNRGEDETGANDENQATEQAGEDYEGETGTAKLSVIVTELMGNKTFTVTVHGIKQRGADYWTLGEPTRPKNKTGDEYTRATTGDSMFLFIFDGAGKEMAYCELEYRDYDAEVVELVPESD